MKKKFILKNIDTLEILYPTGHHSVYNVSTSTFSITISKNKKHMTICIDEDLFMKNLKF